ncbi:MAG: hypothetical protein GEU75_02880 [Dehalococcoidia bacterium]|nr:hypothetical protein [Dehalococcoidia bacterium]
MLNLWIGLCRGVAGLPRDFYDLGYHDKWIEYSFANQDLAHVAPDLIIASKQTQHAILFEIKSGANTDNEQLTRYSRVSQDDLVRRAALQQNEAAQHDVAVMGSAEHQDRLETGVTESGFAFPLVLADKDGIYLHLYSFKTPSVDGVLTPRLEIDMDQVPAFVPVDVESTIVTLAEVVIPYVITSLFQRPAQIRLESICMGICPATWDSMGTEPKGVIRGKVRDVLRRASTARFVDTFHFTNNDILEIRNNPLELGARMQSREFQSLKRRQEEFLQDLHGQQAGARQLGLDEAEANN